MVSKGYPSVTGTVRAPKAATKSNITLIYQLNGNAFDKIIKVEVQSDEAEKIGIKKSAENEADVTVIDALVALHRQLYGDDFVKNPSKYLSVLDSSLGSFVKKSFEDETAIGYFVNDKLPGLANKAVLKDGDILNIVKYRAPANTHKYLYFENKELKATAGDRVKVKLYGFDCIGNQEIKSIKGAEVAVKKGDQIVARVKTNDEGYVEFTASDAGSYILTVISIPKAEEKRNVRFRMAGSGLNVAGNVNAETANFVAPYAHLEVAAKAENGGKINLKPENNKNTVKKINSPETGDDGSTAIALIMMISAACLYSLSIHRKKKIK